MNHLAPPPSAPAKPLGEAPDDIAGRVGQRVRAARKRAKLSRRELSELSSVSQRYLAQIEAGAGNISIALLARVGNALGLSVEQLVARDAGAVEISARYSAADPATQARVNDLLANAQQGPPQNAHAKRIALIGLRGAGKSTLGRKLGARLGAPFVELNREIEKISGLPIGDVIALYGQEGYRGFEARALDRVIAEHDQMVLAVAGGIVSAPDTYRTLLAHCQTIWLRATPEDHMNRVRAQGDERPMEGNPEAMAELRAILASREELYARASAVVDTSGMDEAAALARVYEKLS